MCFSTEASLTAAAVLLPAGVYTTAVAWHRNKSYLMLAALPLLFGVQQLAEAGVWSGLEHGRPELVKPAALAFLFFAIAFWPFWVPLGAAVLEDRPAMRRLFYGVAVLGLALGCLYYVPVVVWFDEWVEVSIVHHSIRYDFSAMPAAQAAGGWIWAGLYLLAVCCPLLLSREVRLRWLGLAVTLSALVSHLVFWYAFASVWCFFGAALSVYICGLLYSLPSSSCPSFIPPGIAAPVRRTRP